MKLGHALAAHAAVLAVAAALVAAALFVDRAPCVELIRVDGLRPREVEPGEPLDIAGEGFPSGQSARVTFRGTLYRPGEAPQSGVEIVASGLAVAPGRVEVPFDDELEALFCRGGDRAVHTSFAGSVEVAFRAASSGQPPIAGVLRRAALDVRPLPGPDDVARDARGERVLSRWGVHVASAEDRESVAGVRVDRVEVGSPAQAAGIGGGDLLVAVDHVRVGRLGDVVPAPGESAASIAVRAAGAEGEVVRQIDLAGTRTVESTEMTGSVFWILAALAFAWFFGAPSPAFVDAAMRPLVLRWRILRRQRTRSSVVRSPRQAGWFGARRRTGSPLGAPAFANGLASGALVALAFGQVLVEGQLDVAVLLVVAIAAACAAVLLDAPSPMLGLRLAAKAAWWHAPAAVSLAGVVAVSGSLRVPEIERAQGGWPWEWIAFRSPASLVSFAFVAALLCAQPRARRPAPGWTLFSVDFLPNEGNVPSRARSPWAQAAVRVHRVLIAALAAALFLGGWTVPGFSPAQQDARPALELLGALVFVAKVVSLVVAGRWAEDVVAAALWRPSSPWSVALSASAVLATVAWSSWPWARAVQSTMSLVLFAGFLLALAAAVERLRCAARCPAAEGHVSPFL